LTELAIDLFEDSEQGGFFLTAKDGEPLLTRPKEIYDGAIPSGNSIMAMNLARLGNMTGDQKFLDCLDHAFSAFSGFLQSNPSGAENFLHSLAFILHPPLEIVITGNAEDPLTQSFLRETGSFFLPFKSVLFLPSGQKNGDLLRFSPHLSAFSSTEEPTFFLCRDFACEQPRTQLDEVKKLLSDLVSPAKLTNPD